MIERKKKYEERVTLTAEAVKYASIVIPALRCLLR